ncbi:MAG: LacI family DNA-binding transcriptional regulator [Eubacteriales bacterium]
MSVKLKDIAADAGVSISTVSRAINGDSIKKVKASTQKKIAASMMRLGYIPEGNELAFLESQNMTGTPAIPTYNVGIILASDTKTFADPFFAEMLDVLQEELYKNNYIITYIISESSVGKEKLKQIVSTQPVSGSIIMGRLDTDLLYFFRSTIPHMVYTGVNYLEHDTDEVICDGFKAVATLYDHFHKLNYAQIGFIGPVATKTEFRNEHHRYTSYINSLELYHHTLHPEWVQASQDTAEQGYHAMKQLIATGTLPRALICASDIIACGVLRATQEHQLRVPEDLAIASIDNINMSQFLTPSLTTIDVSKLELARLSISMLMDKVENRRSKNIRLDIPHELIIRESCGYKLI